MQELSENQFKLLKLMCEKGVMLAFAPHSIETDEDDMRKENDDLLRDYITLTDAGFLIDVTDNFKDLIEAARKKGGRNVTVYGLKQEAYYMFNPPDGAIN